MKLSVSARRVGVAASIAALAVVSLAACGGGGASQPSASREPVAGGALTIITNVDGLTLDPTRTAGNPASLGNEMLPIFDTLIRVGVDGKITPRLATSVTSKDNQNWTIELREGVTFSDGTPFDAAALMFNWKRGQEDKSTITKGDAKTITSMTVTNPKTLDITLASPSSSFPYLLQGPLGMIGSPKAITDKGEDYTVAPVGAGPFVFEKRVPGSSWSYKKNPTYWESGRPYPDTLTIKLIAEPQQAAAAFQAGEADLYVTGDPLVQRDLSDAGYDPIVPDAFGGYMYVFNYANGPTSDVRVRKAITMTLDPQALSKKATQGAATPLATLFPEGSPYYAPEYKWPFQGDLKEAQKLVDSYVAEKGPIDIKWDTIGSDRPWADAIAESVNSSLKNIKITIGTITEQKSLDNLYAGQFSIVLNSLQGFNPTPTLNERLLCGSSRNNGKYCNPKVDSLLKQATVTASQDEKVKLYKQVQQLLTEDVPFFPQAARHMEVFVNDSAGGAALFDAGYLQYESLWSAK